MSVPTSLLQRSSHVYFPLSLTVLHLRQLLLHKLSPNWLVPWGLNADLLIVSKFLSPSFNIFSVGLVLDYVVVQA